MKFIDDFVSYCEPMTGCPRIFLEWAALYALSSVAGSKFRYLSGTWNPKPNIWILILGNSSSFKSIGLSFVEDLLYESEGLSDIIASQEYSHEALIEDVAKNPHRVFFYDEAEMYFKMLAQKYNAPMRSTMMKLYNGRPHKRTIKGKDGRGETHLILGSYICWAGATTPFQISAHLNGSTTDFMSGMFPRFIIVPFFGKEKHVMFPPQPDEQKKRSILETLNRIRNAFPHDFIYTESAKKLIADWIRRFTPRMESADLLVSAFYKKLRDEHFHKVALLSAIERGGDSMNDEDVANAIQLLWPIEKQWPDVIERLTEKEWDRETKRVREFLKSKSGHWVSRSEILRSVRGIKAQKLSAILAGFFQDNQIKDKKDSETDRPTTYVMWVGE